MTCRNFMKNICLDSIIHNTIIVNRYWAMLPAIWCRYVWSCRIIYRSSTTLYVIKIDRLRSHIFCCHGNGAGDTVTSLFSFNLFFLHSNCRVPKALSCLWRDTVLVLKKIRWEKPRLAVIMVTKRLEMWRVGKIRATSTRRFYYTDNITRILLLRFTTPRPHLIPTSQRVLKPAYAMV